MTDLALAPGNGFFIAVEAGTLASRTPLPGRMLAVLHDQAQAIRRRTRPV
jgi:hypothetical protein